MIRWMWVDIAWDSNVDMLRLGHGTTIYQKFTRKAK